MRGAWGAGQSSVEYLLLIIAAVSAFMGLRLYLQRAVAGRLNEARWQVLGGTTPHYADQQDPMTHFYDITSNQQVIGITSPTTFTDFLGRTGTRYDTRFTTRVDFDECQGRTTSGNVNCS